MGMLDYVVNRKSETRERVRQEMLAGKVPRWISNSKRSRYIAQVVLSTPPWVKVPRWISNSKRSRYIAQVVLSTPPWVDRDALKAVQARARALTEMTGVEHHVAHIEPLNHPTRCGLTVPWNLQPKPAKVNMAESNRVIPEEQLALF